MKETILYVGGFVLPDKNAAAQRVIALAKAMREQGHDVFFLNYVEDIKTYERKEYFDFQCFEYPKQKIVAHLSDIQDAIKIIEDFGITCVIAYNYPSIALVKLILFCHHRGVKVIADATEWYVAQGNFLFRIMKTIDTEVRMRWLHLHTDGVIAISRYLFEYYKDKVKTVEIPAVVDIADSKWSQSTLRDNCKSVFVYAGHPNAQKERIDLIVDAIEKMAITENVEFKIIGITREQYNHIYKTTFQGEHTRFFGRVSHLDVIREIKNANWSIVVRENNQVVKAGFPTKIPESISCGTPVIANSFSNISDYLDDSNSILCNMDGVVEAVKKATHIVLTPNTSLFDYHNYMEQISEVLNRQV